MSPLQTALSELREVLRDDASTAATYQEGAGAEVSVNIIVARETLKNLDEKGTERPSYERHILIPADELADNYIIPHSGGRITYTDMAGKQVIAEVNNNADGQCFRLTKSNGFWFQVFTKQLV